MADPTPYEVAYSFSGYQATSPADPLPAGPLDVELAALETTIASLIAALAEVRRSDGNLQNGSVTWDGLDADVQALILSVTDRVTIGDLNAGAFAAQAEAEAGVANDRIMTPLRAKQALDALRAFASQAEAEAGASNTVVMTPLRAKQQVDALRALASQAEAEAGTNNTKVLTPLRGAQQIDALRAALTATNALTWGSIAAGASADQTITVTGAVANDRVVLGLPDGLVSGLIPFAWVSAADTVKIRIHNITAGALTPHSGAATAYAVTVLRF